MVSQNQLSIADVEELELRGVPLRFETSGLAKAVGVSTPTIRIWIKKGLLPDPPRQIRGRYGMPSRIWDLSHVKLALLIKEQNQKKIAANIERLKQKMAEKHRRNLEAKDTSGLQGFI